MPRPRAPSAPGPPHWARRHPGRRRPCRRRPCRRRACPGARQDRHSRSSTVCMVWDEAGGVGYRHAVVFGHVQVLAIASVMTGVTVTRLPPPPIPVLATNTRLAMSLPSIPFPASLAVARSAAAHLAGGRRRRHAAGRGPPVRLAVHVPHVQVLGVRVRHHHVRRRGQLADLVHLRHQWRPLWCVWCVWCVWCDVCGATVVWRPRGVALMRCATQAPAPAPAPSVQPSAR